MVRKNKTNHFNFLTKKQNEAVFASSFKKGEKKKSQFNLYQEKGMWNFNCTLIKSGKSPIQCLQKVPKFFPLNFLTSFSTPL